MPLTAMERLQEQARATAPVKLDDPEAALRAWVAHLTDARSEESPAVRPGSPAAAMAFAVQEIDHLRGRVAEARERAERVEAQRLPAKVAALVQAAYRFADSPTEDASSLDALLDAVKDLSAAQLREPKAEG